MLAALYHKRMRMGDAADKANLCVVCLHFAQRTHYFDRWLLSNGRVSVCRVLPVGP